MAVRLLPVGTFLIRVITFRPQEEMVRVVAMSFMALWGEMEEQTGGDGPPN